MATTKQAHIIAGRMVEFQDRFEKLSNDDAQYVIQNAGEAIELLIAAISNRHKAAAKEVAAVLGEIIATISIPATTKKFVAKDKLILDTSKKAKVKISYLGDNFKTWFLGKTEEAFAGSTIYGRQLTKKSVDTPILAELGGQEETTLTEIYNSMERQANGEAGMLLTNGYANIFYVRDISGTLRAVRVYWYGGGWVVLARSVGYPLEWYAGGRVFSRNSSVTQNL